MDDKIICSWSLLNILIQHVPLTYSLVLIKTLESLLSFISQHSSSKDPDVAM